MGSRLLASSTNRDVSSTLSYVSVAQDEQVRRAPLCTPHRATCYQSGPGFCLTKAPAALRPCWRLPFPPQHLASLHHGKFSELSRFRTPPSNGNLAALGLNLEDEDLKKSLPRFLTCVAAARQQRLACRLSR
jgi:hypothetical protein